MSSTPTCESDFIVLGLSDGENNAAAVRVVATLISVSVTSAWFSMRKIKRLSLFFAHWLSGMVMCVGYVIDHLMVTVCWISSNAEGFIKTLKFIEHSASSMLAITNLAICVNLALIVLSHRKIRRVKSVSSPRLILMFLVISMGVSAASVPFWDTIYVTATGFWVTSFDEDRWDILNVLRFIVEFIVGICMLTIVSWLLGFRMKEIKECWKLHRRIRYYFCLTIIGTAVNLGLGICGMINVVLDDTNSLLVTWSWIFRFIHIALDTFVLYGVLRERNVDERVDGTTTGSGDLSSGQRRSGCGTRNGSGMASNNATSRHARVAPV